MEKIFMGIVFLLFSGLCCGQPHPKPKKQKSLTTAQLYKVGPFLGGQTIANLPEIKSP
jgi:hypothetical protein